MTNRFRPAAVAAALVALAWPIGAGAQMQTFIVDCAAGQSISKALEQGDSRRPLVLTVRGTCTENVTIRRDDVTLQGQAGGNATVTAANAGAALITVKGTRIVIDGLTLNGGLHGLAVTGTHDVSITNCLVRNATQNGLFAESANVLAQNNVIENHGGAGVLLRWSRARLVGNQIRTNAGPGISAQQLASASMAGGNAITGNGAQGILLRNGSLGVLGGETIASNASNGIELTVESVANLSQTTITGNDGGIDASFSHVTVDRATIAGNRRSGLFLTASRAQLTDASITGNGNQGIGGIVGPTLFVTRGTISGNGLNGVSIANNGTVTILGATIQSNGSAGILLSFGSKLLLGGPTDATGNLGWGLDCKDGESSFSGPLNGSISPGCTGY